MPRPTPTLPGIAVLAILLAPAADAQQVLEIDLTTGRTIIDDEWRSMSGSAADWDRNILYVTDKEEPEGIMAFSLETGEWIRTISTPRGDGPHEFSQGREEFAAAPGGGLYVSGRLRVVEYDPQGRPIDSWRPSASSTGEVCNFAGAPAVLTRGGVVRRGPDGTDETIGTIGARDLGLDAETPADARPMFLGMLNAKLACSEDAAYVLTSKGYLMARQEGSGAGVDSILSYYRHGEEGRVAVPAEGAYEGGKCEHKVTIGGRERTRPCPHWSQSADMSLDDRGNIVLLGLDSRTRGAIINPETGCYALIRSPMGSAMARRSMPVAIHADSVLVLRNATREVTDQQGRTVNSVVIGSATRASLHPLRRVGGEPCAGMLPSVS
ncbi:MAG: hypothetical protein OXK74_16995 [Gemmatimonadota bacterium]|nr:hypothetical protein [Gemmatimonadota bacterium]